MPSNLIPGYRAPDLLLARPGGEAVQFPDIELKPTFLYFWAPWHESRDRLGELQEFYRANNFRMNVAGVSFDVRGHSATMQAVRKHGVTFPVFVDNACHSSRLWGITALPTLVLLDADGFVERVSDELSPKSLRVPQGFEQSARRTRILQPPKATPGDLQVEILLQHVTNLLGRGRTDEASRTLQSALKRAPDNEIIKGQQALLQG